MTGVVVREVEVPEGTLVARAFARVDHADAYAVPLPAGAPADLDALARAFLLSRPGWVDGLMGVRDRVMGLFGLKQGLPGAADLPARFVPGARLGLFEVFDRAADELLLGADDRHLAFRVGLVRRPRPAAVDGGGDGAGAGAGAGGADELVVATVVRFENLLGRAYFVPVAPFHRRIVRAMLARAASGLEAG